MEHELKKANMLLRSLILHYHGLDPEEEKVLAKVADATDAHEELLWANKFIAEDYLSAFERSKEFLSKTIGQAPKEKRLEYLLSAWEDNNQKGYVTEMETTAMINLAKDWKIEMQFLEEIQR